MPSGSKMNRDRQCTYNVTVRCGQLTIVAVEKRYVLHIVSLCLSSTQ
jgi:hypothetical protein